MSKAAERWDTKQVLFLFLLISPFFLSYYGYDSIGASLPDLGSFSRQLGHTNWLSKGSLAWPSRDFLC
jgi:hypothetical protein